MLKRLKPTQLQGNLDKVNYFEGWFQKIYSQELKVTFIIIYGFATENTDDEIGFIQIHIPEQPIIHLKFNKADVYLDKFKHHIQFGSQLISNEKIYIKTECLQIDLSITTDAANKVKFHTMGNYYLIPGIPCYHCVMIKNSSVKGVIIYNEKVYPLSSAFGYLEKNWGHSFPKKYLWLHAKDPTNPSNQLLFSQADILWSNRLYKKHFGFLEVNGMSTDFRKIKRNKIIVHLSSTGICITLDDFIIEVEIPSKFKTPILFESPSKGMMNDRISHFSDVRCSLKSKNNKGIIHSKMIGNVENSLYKGASSF